MSGIKKVHKNPAQKDIWILQREYREWAGAGSALFSCGFCAHCQGLVFLHGPGSCCGAEEHSQQPSFSTHTVADSAWPRQKETIWSRGPNAVYLAVNGNLCWPQWELDLILCLLECFGVGYSSNWLFFPWLISASFFPLLFLKCVYLPVV